MLRVSLDLPDSCYAPACRALEELAVRIGLPIRLVDKNDPAELHYGRAPAGPTGRPGVVITLDPEIYDSSVTCTAKPVNGRKVWTSPAALSAGRIDLIGGAWRLLALLDERQIEEDRRDRRGIFVNAALPAGRRESADEPMMEYHADLLWEEIRGQVPGAESARVQRWPEARQFAVAVTHDVDAVHLGAALELANSFAKGLRRRRWQYLRQGLLGLAFVGRTAKNPYWAFPFWRSWEASRGIRSAFYVFHRPAGVPRSWEDCRSAVGGPGADWGVLRQMAQDGWEFGLHPSIQVREVPGAFGVARTWLESKLEQPVSGLRHHFWALDWRNPHRTHRQHEEAGFRYDSSIAWRDQAGFRAGTSLPYRSVDPDSGRSIGLAVIPCSIQDRNVLYSGVGGRRVDAARAAIAARPVLDRVAGTGGLVVLNWHQESAWGRGDHAGYSEALSDILAHCRQLGNAWVATPAEILRHWELRRSQLLSAWKTRE